MLVETNQRFHKVSNFTVRVKDANNQQITLDLERVYVFKYLGVILDPLERLH